MLINCLTFFLVAVLPLETISHYHDSKKHVERKEYDETKRSSEKFNHVRKSYNPIRTTTFKNPFAAKKHDTILKGSKSPAMKTSPVKKRRSVDRWGSFNPQNQNTRRIYPVTTDIPLVFEPLIKNSDYEGGQQYVSAQKVNLNDLDKIREGLRKRFNSYSWRHSFKPILWTNLFKEVEHSLHKMKKIHEEQQKRNTAHIRKFSENSDVLCGGFDLNLSSKRNCKHFNPSSTLKTYKKFQITTIKPISINWNNQLGSKSFPTFPSEMITESYSQIIYNKKYEHNDEIGGGREHDAGRKDHHSQHYSGHHYHQGLHRHLQKDHSHSAKTPHFHPKKKPYHHHCHNKGGESSNYNRESQPVPSGISLKCPHFSEAPNFEPSASSLLIDQSQNQDHSITEVKPSLENTTENVNHSLIDEIWSSDMNDKIKQSNLNFVSSNSSQGSTQISLDISTFEKNESTVFGPPKNASHQHNHINRNTDEIRNVTSDVEFEKPIHFPEDDFKSNEENIKNKNHLCKDGQSIEIPLLNINLPCGDLSGSGGKPDDYYKREFATSMTNVFHDYIDKEKKKDEEKYDIDIRFGKSKRSVNNGDIERRLSKIEPKSSERNSYERSYKVQKERNGSVFGEIMDVPKDLTKPDTAEYFDVSMLSDYFLEAVENLDEANLIDVLKALKDDYLSKSPGDKMVVEEVYDKLVSSLLDYKRANGIWTERQRRESPSKAKEGTAAVLELLAESDKDLEEMQDDPFVNDYYGDYGDKDLGQESNDNPSFLELVSLADKHKSKAK